MGLATLVLVMMRFLELVEVLDLMWLFANYLDTITTDVVLLIFFPMLEVCLARIPPIKFKIGYNLYVGDKICYDHWFLVFLNFIVNNIYLPIVVELIF